MYTYYIPCSCNDVNIAWVCTESILCVHDLEYVFDVAHSTRLRVSPL